MGTAEQAWMDGETRPRVLVGVDGSADGLRAVRYGARHAAAIGGVLHLVHAVDDAVMAGAWGVVYDPSTLQEAGAAANDEAVAVARELGLDDSQVHAEVLLGNGAAVLVRLSEGAALLVVGRRSISGLERMFIGSTSVSVASAAHCPVVVISAAATPEPTGAHGLVGVGIDTHSHSPATLRWAFAEAQRRGAGLQVVHVARHDESSMVTEEVQRAAQQGIDELLAPLRQDFPDVAVQVELATGVAVDELVEHGDHLDLLVLGVPRPRMLGIQLGGVMRAVLAHARCPVALVR